jgi:hypothetical protein
MHTLYIDLSDKYLPFKIGRPDKPCSEWCDTIFTALRDIGCSPSGHQLYTPFLEGQVLKVLFDLVPVDLYKSTLQEVCTYLQDHYPEIFI